MANTKISALTALTGASVDTANDLLGIVDTSATQTKKILINELATALNAATPALASLVTEDQMFSGGVRITSKSLSTGNITIDCGDRPLQYITNGGAFTITAPANDGSIVLLVTNNASAGAITFSGFQVGSSTGDSLTTTNGDDFMISIVRINSIATYTIKALQ